MWLVFTDSRTIGEFGRLTRFACVGERPHFSPTDGEKWGTPALIPPQHSRGWCPMSARSLRRRGIGCGAPCLRGADVGLSSAQLSFRSNTKDLHEPPFPAARRPF